MTNELILLLHIATISAAALLALRLGKEALVAYVPIQMIFANLFVLKQTTLFGLNATSADAYAVGAMVGFNLIQEFYGRALAKKTIYITFFFLVFYVLVSQIHMAYIPSSVDTVHNYFAPILVFAPRLVIASMFVHLIAQTTDFILYGILMRLWHQKFLVLRNYIAIATSQLIDTLMYSAFLWIYGIITNYMHIVIISFAIKFILTLVTTPLITLAAERYKK